MWLAHGAGGTVLALGGCSEPARSQARRVQPRAGESDDALLERLVATGGHAHLPRRAAPYRLTRTVQLIEGTTLTLDPGTRLIWEGPRGDHVNTVGVFEAIGDRVAVLVEGGEAVVACATPATFVYAARMSGRDGFTITGLRGENVQHVFVNAATGDFPRIRMSGEGVNAARNIRITGGGSHHATPQTAGHGACLLSYVIGAEVRGASYDNVPHGVQWWGGNADPARPPAQGGVATERKCRNVTIERVAVRNAGVAGIWGSMGRDVVVRDCVVDTALDVAFDAEGSTNVLFERCVARNGHNGCFVTFFLCNGVRFADCRGTVTNKAFPLVRIYNNTLSNVDNKGVAVTGGTFECSDHSGPATIDTAMGPVQDLTISGVRLRNVRIDTAFLNMHRTVISGNTLDFPYPLPSVAAIRAGWSIRLQTPGPTIAGSVLIEDNHITLFGGGQPGAKPIAIQLLEADFNSTATDVIRGNKIHGPFAVALALANGTANAGIVPRFEVESNRFEKLAPNARTLLVSREGPNAQAPSVRWGAGQTRDGQSLVPAEVLR